MKQLPAYILFENAEEVTRFPEVDFELRAFTPTITKVLLLIFFFQMYGLGDSGVAYF